MEDLRVASREIVPAGRIFPYLLPSQGKSLPSSPVAFVRIVASGKALLLVTHCHISHLPFQPFHIPSLTKKRGRFSMTRSDFSPLLKQQEAMSVAKTEAEVRWGKALVSRD
jgi:hypothetical protein